VERKYEIVFIVKPDTEEDVSKGIVEKVSEILKGSTGEIIGIDDWGKKKMAYPIKKHQDGHYYIIKVSAQPESVKEAERVLKLNDNVIRQMVVRYQPKKSASMEESDVSTTDVSTTNSSEVGAEGGTGE